MEAALKSMEFFVASLLSRLRFFGEPATPPFQPIAFGAG